MPQSSYDINVGRSRRAGVFNPIRSDDIQLPLDPWKQSYPRDINLPPDPTPLDSNRLPMGRLPPGLPGRDPHSDELGYFDDLPEDTSGDIGQRGVPPSDHVLQDEPPADPKAGLASLLGMGNPGADKINTRMLQEDRLDEMRRNRDMMAETGGTMHVGAMPSDISALERDLGEDPDMGTQQQARNADYMKRLYAANLGGFATPQEEAARNQKLEEEKLRQPIEQEKLKGEYALKAEAARAAAAQHLQDTSGEQERYRALARTLGVVANEANAGSRDIRGVSASGVTLGPGLTKVDASLFGRLQAAQKAYDASTYIFGLGGDPAKKAVVDQIQAEINRQNAAVSGAGAPQPGGPPPTDLYDQDEEVNSYVEKLIFDVRTKNLSWTQLQPWLDPAMTAIEKEKLRAALMAKRGF